MEDRCQADRSNHDGGLWYANNVALGVCDKEEQADKSDLHDVYSGKQLGKCVFEELSMGVDLVPLHIVIVVSVCDPEKCECGRHEDQHQRCDDRVYKACARSERRRDTQGSRLYEPIAAKFVIMQ